MNILTMSQDSTESIEATYIELWEDAIGTSEMFEASSQCHSLTHSLTPDTVRQVHAIMVANRVRLEAYP